MNKNILITGVSSGLGYGLAQFYLDQNFQVYALNRNFPEDFKNIDNFHFVSVDFVEQSNIINAIDELLDTVEILDLVVLNAGILNAIKDLKDTPLDEVQQIMQINVWANKIIIDRLCGSPRTIKQVVGISSGASQAGTRGWNAYALSKASLNMLLGLYAQEFEETHFSALAPGLVDTKMQDYICDLAYDEKYPIVERLKQAKGTEIMPNGIELAPKLDQTFAKLLRLDSGSYADIREI